MKVRIPYAIQLLSSYIFLILLALLIFFLVVISVTKKNLEKTTIKMLSNELIYVENILDFSAVPSSIEAVLNSISKLNGYQLRLTIIGEEGFVKYDSSKNPSELDDHSTRPEFLKALDGQIGSEIRFSKSTNMKMIYVAKQSKRGTVYRLSIPVQYLETKWMEIFNEILILMLTILTITLILTAYMATRISRPLNWTLDTIEKIRNKEFDDIESSSSMISEVNQVNNRLYQMSRDIQQTLKKVSKEKEKKDIILNNMINGLIVTNKNSEIKLMNQSAYHLFFNLMDKSNKITLSDFPDILEYSKKILSDHIVDPLEINHSNGTVILVTGSVYLEGKAPQGILIAQDITKLKQLENTRQEFVANVSHELKTPITYIRSLIETILVSKEKGIDLDSNFITKAISHTDRLTNIINDLLQLSKLEAGEVEKEDVFISTVIEAAIQENLIKAQEKNIKLISRGVNKKISCNFSLMIQAIKNLIENAIKFSRENNEVIIDCSEGDFTLDINIIDFGAGISQAHIPKLFQRFYRVDTARSRQQGGTGLGLSIVKHIAQVHGGEAIVKSELDKGSTFIIRLPN